MKRLAQLTLVGILLTAAVPARAGEVKLSFSNGLVTIVATDASPRQILAEWAKLGQVRIINLERLSGGPVTLQLTSVPEAQALETLLRGSAGYVAAPRQAAAAEATSRYDRILLMPGVAPAMPPATSSAAAPQPTGRGRVVSLPTFDAAAVDDDDVSSRASCRCPRRAASAAGWVRRRQARLSRPASRFRPASSTPSRYPRSRRRRHR